MRASSGAARVASVRAVLSGEGGADGSLRGSAGAVLRKWFAAPAIAALWVAIEWTHSYTGFEWLNLGNAGERHVSAAAAGADHRRVGTFVRLRSDVGAVIALLVMLAAAPSRSAGCCCCLCLCAAARIFRRRSRGQRPPWWCSRISTTIPSGPPSFWRAPSGRCAGAFACSVAGPRSRTPT